MGKLKFIAGAVVGAAAALMFAPRSGKETRALMSNRVEEYASKAPEPVKDAYDTVREKVEDVADAAEPAADDIKDRIGEARERIAEQIVRNRSTAKEVAADVSDIPGDIADAAHAAKEAVTEDKPETEHAAGTAAYTYGAHSAATE